MSMGYKERCPHNKAYDDCYKARAVRLLHYAMVGGIQKNKDNMSIKQQ